MLLKISPVLACFSIVIFPTNNLFCLIVSHIVEIVLNCFKMPILHSTAVLSMPLSLPPGMSTPIWIGSYLNFASSPTLWDEWGGLLNGTFGWAPFIEKPTPPGMSEWDYYGTLEDAVEYQVHKVKSSVINIHLKLSRSRQK